MRSTFSECSTHIPALTYGFARTPCLRVCHDRDGATANLMNGKGVRLSGLEPESPTLYDSDGLTRYANHPQKMAFAPALCPLSYTVLH